MKGRRPFSSTALTALLFFSVSQTAVHPGAFAAEPVAGVIQSIKPLDAGRYELTVQGAEGKVFVVSASTLIEGTIPAKEVKQGQKILLPGARDAGGIRGMTAMKNPFGNMSSEMKKQLGLPDMPDVPEVPGVPEVPALPKLPDIPELPKTSGAPDLPNLPEGGGAPAGGGGAPAGGGMPMPGGLGGMMGGGEGGGEKVEHKADPLPPPEEMLGPKAPVLTPAEGAAPAAAAAAEAPKTVADARSTEEGVEINFEGESEKVVLPADAPVRKIMEPSELRESMQIVLNAEEINGENIVQKLQVV